MTMNCQDCELLLEEYLDGETDGRAATAVAAHLKACAACSEIHDGLLAEQSLYASYERDVEVTPELWGNVEARLRAEQNGAGDRVSFLQRLSGWLAPLLVAPRFSPALTAALVVVAIAVTAVVMKSLDGNDNAPVQTAQVTKNETAARPAASPSESPSAPSTAAPSTPAPSSSPAVAPSATPQPKQRVVPRPADPNKALLAAGTPPKQGPKTIDRASAETPADRLVREAEQRYVAAIRILERDVNSRRQRLDARTVARFDETLASIDRTIAETRKTARQHGNDPVAVQYMLSAYAKKVEVMREMASIGGQ